MHVPFNDLRAHHESLQPELSDSIQAVIRESAFIRGPAVDAFEREFAALIGSPHCISCANGTDALYIAMRALGIAAGDEVITTAHSWISTSETITQAGGQVVFCDTDADTFTINPSQIAGKITARTKGIIPVHLYGQAADMDPILDLARTHNLWVIEDCAQAHLATYHGRHVGTMGDASTFSFYPGKNLGAMGDAGGILTQRADLAEWMATFARHGGKGNHQIEGINSRMDGLQGAVLRLKLPHLARWTARRVEIAAEYNSLLAGVGDLTLPAVASGRDHVYHLYVVKSRHREQLRAYLKEKEIETVLNYPKALPFYPAYGYLKHQPDDFPNAFAHQSQILSLPIFPEMNQAQIHHVVNSIKAYFASKAG
jgi:dTDP-4-amino-4,6-dideoxygalactose transaminase